MSVDIQRKTHSRLDNPRKYAPSSNELVLRAFLGNSGTRLNSAEGLEFRQNATSGGGTRTTFETWRAGECSGLALSASSGQARLIVPQSAKEIPGIPAMARPWDRCSRKADGSKNPTGVRVLRGNNGAPED
jgi:hypothetical protein